MNLLPRRIATALAVASLVTGFSLVPSAAAQTSSTVLNFDSVNASSGPVPAAGHLGGYGITITGVSGAGTPAVTIQAAQSWLTTASTPNALVGPGGASATSYTLNLPSAVTSISFSRGGPNSSTSAASWTATALSSSGQTVATVGESSRCCTFAPQTFTLAGTGITALRIDSGGCSCGIQSPWIDDLTFSPALSSGSASVAGSASITAGTLSLGTPTNIGFSGTLTGLNQVFTAANGAAVTDASGSGNGWNLTIAGTLFSTGGGTPRTLPADALRVTAASATAAANSSGVNPSNTVAYPLTVPLGASPTAAKFFNAASNTGLGKFDLSLSYGLHVPANTFAGTYTSTLTVSLVSGP